MEIEVPSDLIPLLHRGRIVEVRHGHGVRSTYRVLMVHPQRDALCWIGLRSRHTAVPEWIALSEFLALAESGDLSGRTTDPKAILFTPSEAAERVQKARWRIVEAVLAQGELQFLESSASRARVVAQVSKGLKVPAIAVRRAMTLYLLNGLNPLALYPRFRACGVSKRPRLLGEKKVGRPRQHWPELES